LIKIKNKKGINIIESFFVYLDRNHKNSRLTEKILFAGIFKLSKNYDLG
jgi:hypothetical protein